MGERRAGQLSSETAFGTLAPRSAVFGGDVVLGRSGCGWLRLAYAEWSSASMPRCESICCCCSCSGTSSKAAASSEARASCVACWASSCSLPTCASSSVMRSPACSASRSVAAWALLSSPTSLASHREASASRALSMATATAASLPSTAAATSASAACTAAAACILSDVISRADASAICCIAAAYASSCSAASALMEWVAAATSPTAFSLPLFSSYFVCTLSSAVISARSCAAIACGVCSGSGVQRNQRCASTCTCTCTCANGICVRGGGGGVRVLLVVHPCAQCAGEDEHDAPRASL